ncbi:hypothetical protein GE09DRAFT_1226072 [Coniochaeta sp. 2T2.1]|nr:hypothetical protein GE09DRAFT_1226072 [Coniochaeta sp. 2T2.1]
MCYYLELSAMACHHNKHAVFPCSNPSICKPVPYIHYCHHPAECPLCLDGNLWPGAAYTSTEIAANVRSAVADEIAKSQAQQLLNFVTYWLSDQYSLWDETGQDMVMSAAEATEHEKFMLWVYYQETYCSHCISRPAFGQHCRTCEASETTQNIVNLFRKQCVQRLALENFSNHEDAIEEIKTSYVKPPHPTLENVSTWPLSRDRVAQRCSIAVEKVMSYMEQRLDGTRARPTGEEELYRYFGLQILTIASSLMAFDTGLVDQNMINILRYLAQILPYPDDRDQYTWSHKPALGLPAYRRVAMACIRQDGPVFITKMKRMNEALQQGLENIRTRQQTAMNERKGEMVVARLKHYSTALNHRHQLEPDWICAICQDGMDVPSGGVIKLNACGHVFHTDCIRDGIVQSTHGSTACPMCRKTFDGINVNDDAHWWSMRMEQND